MRINKLISNLLAVGLMLSALYGAVPVQAQGTQWAMLIGIDDYEDDTINKLDMCINDVRNMEKALTRASFRSANIVTMTSNIVGNRLRPTRANVLRQLDD